MAKLIVLILLLGFTTIHSGCALLAAFGIGAATGAAVDDDDHDVDVDVDDD
jgi:hypothetical protein